jgi:thiol-disulfide isomerase/thioredoxin
MKNILITLGCFISLVASAQYNTVLKGKITNPTGDSVFVFTREYLDKQWKTNNLGADKLNEKGAFTIKLNLDKPILCTFSDGNEQTQVLLNPGDDVSMSLNTKLFDETIVYYGKGSEKNNAIKNVALFMESVYSSAYSFDLADSLQMFKFIEKQIELYGDVLADYTIETPSFDLYSKSKLEDLNGLTSNVIMNTMISKFMDNEAKEMKKELTGSLMVDFVGEGLKGEQLKLSQYKGKVTVIDFWATWCGPCKAEMPSYKKLEEKYGKDINFLSVCVYDEKDKWKAMATDLGFEHNIFIEKTAMTQFEKYKINGIPRYMVVDKDMNILDVDAPRPSSGDLEKFF